MDAPGIRSRPFPWSTFDGDRDHEIAERLRRHAGDLLHIKDLDGAVDGAIDLLEEPRIWEAVERVAAQLLRYREIGYKELQFAVLGF